MSTGAGEEISRYDAETATSQTLEFLKRLGRKESWSPTKVSLDGELYIVEMIFKQLTAKIQINSKTKEIKEYEFQQAETTKQPFINFKTIIFLGAGVGIGAVIMLLLAGTPL
jgi:hypothetical protein